MKRRLVNACLVAKACQNGVNSSQTHQEFMKENKRNYYHAETFGNVIIVMTKLGEFLLYISPRIILTMILKWYEKLYQTLERVFGPISNTSKLV